MITEIEPRQPWHRLFDSAGDLVEIVLHARSERIVDKIGEVAFEQRYHAERDERRDECGALLPHIAAVLDGAHDRRVGRRATDAQFLETLHERRLGVAGRRLGCMRFGRKLTSIDEIAFSHRRQAAFRLVAFGVVIDVFHVCPTKSRFRDDRARRAERDTPLRGIRGVGLDAHHDRFARGINHLRGHGALPDQLVDARLAGSQLAGDLLGRAERVTGRANGLMGLLRVLDLGRVHARCARQALFAITLGDQRSGGVDRGLGQRGAVRTHVRDVALFVQRLRGTHGHCRRQPELAPRFLLERRCHERRCRSAAIRLRLDRCDRELRTLQARGECHRRRLVEHHHVAGLRLTQWVEVTAARNARAVEGLKRGPEGLGFVRLRITHGKGGLEIPERRGHEPHAFALALDHDAGRNALHATGRQARADLLPQHGRHFIAVQPIEQASRLLRVDQATIELAWILDGFTDRLRRDLVEHHAFDRHPRVQHLEQMPGDRLALAILVGRKIDLVDRLHQALQLLDLLAPIGRHHIQRLEVVVDIDAESGPWFGLICRRNVGCASRKVAHVPDR